MSQLLTWKLKGIFHLHQYPIYNFLNGPVRHGMKKLANVNGYSTELYRSENFSVRYVRMYVCVYVCVCVCTYVRMYVCVYVCMCVCMYECMYVCMYVRMYVCMYATCCAVQVLL